MSGVIYSIKPEYEDLPIEGNAVDSGDAEADAEIEAHIRSELERGNIWAWCTVRVTRRTNA